MRRADPGTGPSRGATHCDCGEDSGLLRFLGVSQADAIGFRLGTRFVLVGLRLLLAAALFLAGLVVALLLGDVIVGLCLGDLDLVLRVGGAGALRRELGHRDLLLALRLGHADVLRIAGLGLAIRLRRLVVGFDALLIGAVIRACRHLGVLDRMRYGASGRHLFPRGRRRAGLAAP